MAAAANLQEPVSITPVAGRNQGSLNACVGFTFASCGEILIPTRLWLSARDIWIRAKRLGGFSGNTGCYPNHGGDVLIGGVCADQDFPTDVSFHVDQESPAGLRTQDPALAHQLISGSKVAGVWGALKAGHPVAAGFLMDADSFFAAPRNRGLIDSHNRSKPQSVAHEMYVWKVTPQYVIGRNSWGDWLGAGPYVDPEMTAWDWAMTHDVFESACFDAREVTPEPRFIPRPDPRVDPKAVQVIVQEWHGDAARWDITTQAELVIPFKESGWVGYVTIVPGEGARYHFERIDLGVKPNG